MTPADRSTRAIAGSLLQGLALCMLGSSPPEPPGVVVSLVPRCQLGQRDLHEAVGVCAARVDVLEDFGPDLVVSELGQDVHPHDIVEGADYETMMGKRLVVCSSRSVNQSSEMTYMPMPVTQYVAYQNETSPAYGPPLGGTQGMTST